MKIKGCVDYTDLNKVCSNDNYPLPRIDQLINVFLGHELLIFMELYHSHDITKSKWYYMIINILPSSWHMFLSSYVLRVKKCKGTISKDSEQNV